MRCLILVFATLCLAACGMHDEPIGSPVAKVPVHVAGGGGCKVLRCALALQATAGTFGPDRTYEKFRRVIQVVEVSIGDQVYHGRIIEISAQGTRALVILDDRTSDIDQVKQTIGFNGVLTAYAVRERIL